MKSHFLSPVVARPAPPALKALVALLALGLFGCQPPKPNLAGAAGPAGDATFAPAVAAPHRVILISLDGASSQELHRLHREGALTEGGFERFFRDGAVAEGMVPVNPTLTSVNHISLATGATADRTGIVGNTFHPAVAAWGKTVSGFAAEIGSETLWEAARRQGKRVGVTTWPGADALSQRRMADWGMIYVNNPDRASDLATLSFVNWRNFDGEPPFETWSPLLSATLTSAPAPGAQPDTYELLALDHTDDDRVDYDAVSIKAPQAPEPVVLPRGGWGTVPCSAVVGGPAGAAAVRVRSLCPVKLVDLDPALARVSIYLGGVYSLRAYPADFVAQLTARGLSWPGPPDDRRLEDAWAGRPGIDLDTWSEQSERFARFFGDGILAAAAREDWDLLMSYIPVIDEAGHQLLLTDPRQKGYSEERKRACAAARLRTWKAVDREIARLLATVDLGRTTVVLVADHGMTPVHTALDANVLLREKGLLVSDSEGRVVAEKSAAIAVSGGGICHVYVAPGRQDLLPQLRGLFADWRAGDAGSPLEEIVTRVESWKQKLDSPNSGDLMLFAKEGFSFHGNGLKDGRAAFPSQAYGMHGYLNSHADMHPIYMALGAGARKGDTRPLRSTDVAGRVAAWLGIRPPGEP